MPMAKHLGLRLMVVALCSLGLVAQTHISISGRPSGHGPSSVVGHRSGGISFGESARRRPFRRNLYSYGAPYFYSDYDSYGPDYPPPPPAPQSAPAVPVKPEPVPDAVMLELRGNQWVRVTSLGEASEQTMGTGVASQFPQTPQQQEMAPAILVYRDGHSEEVSSYSIIGQV